MSAFNDIIPILSDAHKKTPIQPRMDVLEKLNTHINGNFNSDESRLGLY
jgi:hypothetical protein